VRLSLPRILAPHAPFIALMPATAHAQTLGAALCGGIVSNMGVLSAVASLGVILIGVAATVGNVTWKQAILVATGIAVLFGASSIAFSIAGSVDLDGNGIWTAASDHAAVLANWCPGL
jgi:type IV secretory pathway VirB2 component (pilin)